MNPDYDLFEWQLTRRSLAALCVYFAATWIAALAVQSFPGQLSIHNPVIAFSLRTSGAVLAIAGIFAAKSLRLGSAGLSPLAFGSASSYFALSVLTSAAAGQDPVSAQASFVLVSALFILQVGFFTRRQAYTLIAGAMSLAIGVFLFRGLGPRVYSGVLSPGQAADALFQVMLFAVPMVTGFVFINNKVAQTLTGKAWESAEAMKRLAYFDHETGLANGRSLESSIRDLKPPYGEGWMLVGIRVVGHERAGELSGLSAAGATIRRFGLELGAYLAERHTGGDAPKAPASIAGPFRLDQLSFAFASADEADRPLAGLEEALARLIIACNAELSGAPLSFIGAFARYPADADSPTRLLKNLMNALNGAKAPGRLAPFNPAAYADFVRRERLRVDLAAAVGRGEVYALYQPKFAKAGAELAGFEALARWRHPELGEISPGEFIPIAEDFSLIAAISSKIIELSLGFIRRLEAAGLPETSPARVSINLSPTLLEPSYLSALAAALSASGLARRVELEITEGSVMVIDELAASGLAALRAIGVGFSIDDFGTGYSNLGYLQTFKTDALKIDRRFVGGLPSDPQNAALVRAIIQVAQAFGMKTVAEGVEYAEQARFVEEAGCDQIQGFLYARPMSEDDALALAAGG